MDKTVLEVVGYAASILIAISLMMRSILRLRVINLVGSLVFTVYGVLIQAYPVAAVNFIITLINIYYLLEMSRRREFFSLLEVHPGSEYLAYFLQFYARDIQRFLPGFQFALREGQLGIFILRNAVPAGVLIGELHPQGRLVVSLDYVIPGYRDFKAGTYIFGEQADFFRQRGIRQVCSPPGSPAHRAYLERMGFCAEEGQDGQSCLCLVIQ